MILYGLWRQWPGRYETIAGSEPAASTLPPLRGLLFCLADPRLTPWSAFFAALRLRITFLLDCGFHEGSWLNSNHVFLSRLGREFLDLR